MCPACVVGIIFIAQLFGVVRWFKRVVLKKPVANDEDYWVPDKSMLTPKMQAFASDKRKVVATFIVIAVEISLVIIIYNTVGFGFFKKIFMLLQ